MTHAVMSHTLSAILSAALLVAGLVMPANAHLTLTLRTDHAKYLEFEPVMAFLTIKNEGKEAFLVRAEDINLRTRIMFHVERSNNRLPQRITDGPMVTSSLILPGEEQEIMCNISSHYRIGKSSGYNVWASVDWNGSRFESNRAAIKVITGLPLTSERRTVAVDGVRRERRFSLRYLNREGSESLFFVADDPEDQINYGVFELGSLLRFHKPSMNIDSSGKITVYHQANPTVFVQSLILSEAEGLRLLDQQYRTENRKGHLEYSTPETEPIEKPAKKRGWWPFGRD